MLPGGPFRGVAVDCGAADWSHYATVPEFEIEVQPEAPRSLTTWGLVYQSDLYIPADFLTPWKRWPQQVEKEPRIRVRVDDRVFSCHAARITDEVLVARLREEAAAKYKIEPDGWAARAEVWWFRVGSPP